VWLSLLKDCSVDSCGSFFGKKILTALPAFVPSVYVSLHTAISTLFFGTIDVQTSENQSCTFDTSWIVGGSGVMKRYRRDVGEHCVSLIYLRVMASVAILC
jgi:hypothetical protein